MKTNWRLDEDIIKFYNTNGAVYIPNALNLEEVECLKNGIRHNLENLSIMGKVASSESDIGLFVEDFCTWQNNPYYKRIIFNSSLSEIARLLMQTQPVRLYHDHMLIKEPYTQTITPWHQDLPYYNITGMQNCSFWIPIDPVDRESTLEFIAGSHLGPWYMPRTFKDSKAKWFAEGTLAELPSDQEIRSANKILAWPMKPGDVVAFNMLTIHGSNGVPKNQHRRALSLRFIGDDIRFAPRDWQTSPDFPGLNQRLKPGSIMDDELFPIIY